MGFSCHALQGVDNAVNKKGALALSGILAVLPDYSRHFSIKSVLVSSLLKEHKSGEITWMLFQQ